jgi:hypothetical protein
MTGGGAVDAVRADPESARGAPRLRAFTVSRCLLPLASALVIALALAPIIGAAHLPVLDAASHEARLVALRQLLGEGGGTPFYALDTLFLANMGFDFVGLALTQWVDPLMAGRLFLGGSMVLTFTGVMALNRVAVGAWRPWPLVSALLLYNLFTVLGFLGYGLGVGLLFWALAARIFVARFRLPVQFAVGAIAGVVLLFCHVSAFGIYAVMVAGLGLDMLWRQRGALVAVALMAAELAPAMGLYALMAAGGHEAPRYDLPYWRSKLLGAVDTLSSGSMAGDAAFCIGAVSVLVALCCGRVSAHRGLRVGLALLALLYFVIPGHVSGGSYVDARLPVVIMLLGIASCRVEARWKAGAWAVAGVAAAAFVVKQAALTTLWSAEGVVLAEIAETFARLPRGAVIFQSECHADPGDLVAVYRSRQPPLPHVAAMAAFDGTRFAPVSWALKGQQPIRVTAAYRPFKDFQDGLSTHTCTQDEYRAVLAGARAVAAHQAASGGVVPPMYLLLLRPDAPALLTADAVLVGWTPEIELYAVR